jgi:hypothetical protein
MFPLNPRLQPDKIHARQLDGIPVRFNLQCQLKNGKVTPSGDIPFRFNRQCQLERDSAALSQSGHFHNRPHQLGSAMGTSDQRYLRKFQPRLELK